MAKNAQDVVIVSAVRTPFDKYGGVLKDVSSIDLAAVVMKEALKRVDLPPKQLDAIYYGSCEPCEYGMDIGVPARQALIKAGLPMEIVSISMDSACCSSMDALTIGTRDLKLGESSVVLVVGTENMGRQAYYAYPSFRFEGARGDIVLKDPIRRGGNYPVDEVGPVSVDAGEVALEYGISREEQDWWGYNSQMKYKEAYKDGKFKDEMMSPFVVTQDGKEITLDIDKQHRPSVTMEKLAKLPTVYGSPTVTPGNAPGINTGASAILITTRAKAQELGLEPLARIVSQSRSASLARRIAAEPAQAIKIALEKANLTLDDMDLIEINEAFAAMPLVSTKILADEDEKKYKSLLEKVNVNGGSIAIGHPVGATGARIVMTLMYELRRSGGKYGVAALCGGLSQAAGTIIEVE